MGLGELLVACANSLGHVLWDVGDQCWLVDLHPLGAAVGDAWQQARVGGEEVLQQVEGLGAIGGACQREVGQWADEHGANSGARALNLVAEILQESVVVQGECGVGGQLRNDVVVVRVEPLRHCGSWQFGGAAGSGEVAVDESRQAVVAVVGDVRHALWEGAQEC